MTIFALKYFRIKFIINLWNRIIFKYQRSVIWWVLQWHLQTKHVLRVCSCNKYRQIFSVSIFKLIFNIHWIIITTQQWPQAWKRSVFIPIPKKCNAKECSNYCTIALISHASKVRLKILQARLQQYVNCELPDVQAGFRKGRETRDQIANICWIMEKGREFQKNIYFCFIDYAKALDCVDHNKLWKILKEMGIPDQPTCLLRKQYAGLEATVRTGHGTTDCSK